MKQHPTYPEIWVTDEGEVFRHLVPSKDPFGYHQIRNGKIRERRHVLVCEAFHGKRAPGKVVRHFDGDSSNDNPANLCWGTQAQNMQDAVFHGTTTKGEKNSNAKLTKANMIEIRARRLAGESGKSLALEFGVSQSTVCDIYKQRTWYDDFDF